MENSKTGQAYVFKWKYIALPATLLFISVILTLVFYARLPQEMAWRFDADGSPVSTATRGVVLLWGLGIQFLLLLAALLATRTVIGLANRFIEPETAVINPERTFMLMGNMPVLLQAIISFALADIFSYNSNQVHLPPVWIFAIIILVLGGVILSIYAYQAVRAAWKANKE